MTVLLLNKENKDQSINQSNNQSCKPYFTAFTINGNPNDGNGFSNTDQFAHLWKIDPHMKI